MSTQYAYRIVRISEPGIPLRYFGMAWDPSAEPGSSKAPICTPHRHSYAEARNLLGLLVEGSGGTCAWFDGEFRAVNHPALHEDEARRIG